jgi:hypothetical protein
MTDKTFSIKGGARPRKRLVVPADLMIRVTEAGRDRGQSFARVSVSRGGSLLWTGYLHDVDTLTVTDLYERVKVASA